jgi:seryl-tRNA synthetase
MSFQLTKDQDGTLAKLIDDLTLAKQKITAAANTYNDEVAELRPSVEEAVTEFNNLLGEIRQLVSDIVTRGNESIDQKSDKWQESEKGEAAREWVDAWDGLDLSDLDFSWPDELEIDVPEYDSELEDLPKEMNEA